MQFCLATVEYFESHGFDTSGWRKSLDGTKALVHLEYAQTLIPNILSDIMNVIIYQCPSTDLDNLLNSSQWSVQEG